MTPLEEAVDAYIKYYFTTRDWLYYQDFACNAAWAVEKAFDARKNELDKLVFHMAHELWTQSGKPWL